MLYLFNLPWTMFRFWAVVVPRDSRGLDWDGWSTVSSATDRQVIHRPTVSFPAGLLVVNRPTVSSPDGRLIIQSWIVTPYCPEQFKGEGGLNIHCIKINFKRNLKNILVK